MTERHHLKKMSKKVKGIQTRQGKKSMKGGKSLLNNKISNCRMKIAKKITSIEISYLFQKLYLKIGKGNVNKIQEFPLEMKKGKK